MKIWSFILFLLLTSLQQPGTWYHEHFLLRYPGMLCLASYFFFSTIECLRKYVFFYLLLQKLSRRQYLRYIFLKRAKMYFIEGRFWSKVAVYFVPLFHWPTTHRAFVRGRTPLQRPIVPQTNRTGQTGQAPLFVQQQHKQWTHRGLRA